MIKENKMLRYKAPEAPKPTPKKKAPAKKKASK